MSVQGDLCVRQSRQWHCEMDRPKYTACVFTFAQSTNDSAKVELFDLIRRHCRRAILVHSLGNASFDCLKFGIRQGSQLRGTNNNTLAKLQAPTDMDTTLSSPSGIDTTIVTNFKSVDCVPGLADVKVCT